MNKLAIAGIVVIISILIVWGYHSITHPDPIILSSDSTENSLQGTSDQSNRATETQTVDNSSINNYSEDSDDDAEDD